MSAGSRAPRVRDFVVVGGGIAGCSVALQLARRGLGVTLIEQRQIAAGASGRNQGLLLNQVEPEVVRVMGRSLEIYRELENATPGFDLRPIGQLLLARDGVQMRVAEQKAAAMAELGMETERWSIEQVRSEVPQISPNLAGGYFVKGAHAIRPYQATQAFAQGAREAGAELLTRTRVGDVLIRSGKVEGVLTDQGPIAADAVILATGPWLADLAPGLPVTAARGWVLRTAQLPFRVPFTIEEMSWPDQDELGRVGRPPTLAEVAGGGYDQPAVQAFVINQHLSGEALVGASMAPSLREAVEGIDMPRRIAEHALELAPGLAGVSITAAWYGMRPMTPDGMPLAGPAGADGLFAHGGHGSIGMMSAPAIGRWLVDSILDGRSEPELARYSAGRFVSSSPSTSGISTPKA